jgi:lambda repressor-like predicted transcriptional regulator
LWTVRDRVVFALARAGTTSTGAATAMHSKAVNIVTNRIGCPSLESIWPDRFQILNQRLSRL